jgi:hypothetical protein
MRLVLYSKPGCHLCEGLQEKLEQVQNPSVKLEVRDITSREDWFQAFQYEIPVLFLEYHQDIRDAKVTSQPLPRLSPRASVPQVEQMLCNYISHIEKNIAK